MMAENRYFILVKQFASPFAALLILLANSGIAQIFHVDMGADSLLFSDGDKIEIAAHNHSITLPQSADSLSIIIDNVVFLPHDKKINAAENLPSAPKWFYQKGISAKKTIVTLSMFPLFRNDAGRIQRIVSFDCRIESMRFNKKQNTEKYRSASNSVLATNLWYKWSVSQTGVYKIDYSAIKSAGIAVNNIGSLDNIKIHGRAGKMLPHANSDLRSDDLPELAVQRIDNGNGLFDQGDYILFFAEGPCAWNYDSGNGTFAHEINLYSDSIYFYLTINNDSPKNIAAQAEESAPATIKTYAFDDLYFREKEEDNLLHSGRLWLGDHFQGSQTQSFQFICPNAITPASLTVSGQFYGKSNNNIGSSFLLNVNGSSNGPFAIGKVSGNATDDIAKNTIVNFSAPSIGDTINIDIQYSAPDSYAEGWINYLEILARRKLKYDGTPLYFRDRNSLGGIPEYHLAVSSAGAKIWDVSDLFQVREQQFRSSADSVFFRAKADALREFVMFNPSTAATPKFEEKINNQNLHAIASAALIIVTHPSFLAEAQRLANFHRQIDSLSVQVVDILQIYNEFSAGIADVAALRDFVKMLYDKAAPSDVPKYLLLFGDGTFDYKHILKGLPNFVPTYQSLNSTKSTSSYTSDDFFGLLDDSEGRWAPTDPDLLDIGIGRLPVNSADQAKNVVDKILAYCNYFDASNSFFEKQKKQVYSSWRNEALFIADDEDFNIHINQANQLATKMENEQEGYNINKIYIDAYQQTRDAEGDKYPEASAAIKNKIENGAYIVNYTGHGGEEGLTSEGVFKSSDVVDLNNGIKMPLFVTATCEFSRYDLTQRTTAGELLLLNPHGGAIALFTTVRLVFSTPNFNLNKTFYNVAFSQPEGYKTRLGDIFKMTKVINNGGTNDRNFTLLGDPAMRMALPREKIKVNAIVDLYNNTATDTLKALLKVRISGSIRDTAGNKLTNFNGTVQSTLFDKTLVSATLANDNGTNPFSFDLQQNVLFKGSATVKQGDFTFDCLIPKGIAPSFGNGKLSFYAYDEAHGDAQGSDKSIIVGGYSNKAPVDVSGPTISLYLNDSTFVYGGFTNNSPTLIISAFDSSGMNVTVGGIGHGMTAILDNNTAQVIPLSAAYTPKIDDYRQGSIRYRLSDLAEGKHTIEAKLWDNYDNSTSAYTEFVVSYNAKTALEHVLNYPNPFTTKTGFYFEHNQIGRELDVTIQIYTISGKLIKTLTHQVYADNRRVGPIDWDGMDDFGDSLGRGVYLYQIKVKSENGTSAHIFEKLVLLK